MYLAFSSFDAVVIKGRIAKYVVFLGVASHNLSNNVSSVYIQNLLEEGSEGKKSIIRRSCPHGLDLCFVYDDMTIDLK